MPLTAPPFAIPTLARWLPPLLANRQQGQNLQATRPNWVDCIGNMLVIPPVPPQPIPKSVTLPMLPVFQSGHIVPASNPPDFGQFQQPGITCRVFCCAVRNMPYALLWRKQIPTNRERLAMNLFEKYRPTSFADVIGQDKAVRSVDLLRKRGFGGRAIWLSGPSGTGKTTIARLIASEVADDWSTIEIDATGLTAADIERIADKARGKTITGRGWCIIVNEAHGLTRGTIRKLLTTMEPIPASTTWIFTTTCEGQEILFGE